MDQRSDMGSVDPSNLEIGELYFMLWYADEAEKYVCPDAVVFIGTNIEGPEDEDRWYFQDPESFCTAGAFPQSRIDPSAEDRGRIYKLREAELDQLVDSEGLRQEVTECEARRSKG